MKHILIVDDNKLNLTAAKNVLCDKYKVTAVTKGRQAVAFMENNTCDIILLDINMPEMDGFEVYEKIRGIEGCKDVPIIFLTADNDFETETKCLSAGAVDFIAKPFVPDIMRLRIGRILELEDLRRSLADKLEIKMQEVVDLTGKSNTDPLTGLWNRAYTKEAAEKFMQDGGCGSLMMIDLDNFKIVNDKYGHIAGDEVLKAIADTLREFSSESDVLCRIGGDEFIVFVKDEISKVSLGERAMKIIGGITDRIKQMKLDTNTSASIGISQTPDDGTDFTTLYNCADKALYYVKQNGKSFYHFFSDQNEDEIRKSVKAADLQYISEIMSRSDNGQGAYLLNFDSFQHVYNFIRRFVKRNKLEVQTLLFTIAPTSAETLEAAKAENALELLEQAVYISLRRVDVCTRYSSKQLIVVLMDTDTKSAEIVAKRIITCFERLYGKSDVAVDYGVAKMPDKEKDE